jgi:two-component system response regulator AtoC
MDMQKKEPKALLVDDEVNLLDLLKQVTETIGLKPICAQDGEEAYALYQKEHPDIIITDIYMPKINGLELLKRIKKDEPETPVVLITGYAHYRQLVANSIVKPDGFLEKPFNIKKLIEIILFYFPQLNKTNFSKH